MKWSLSLGRVAGIHLQVHWTFLLIILWVIFVFSGPGTTFFDYSLAVIYILTIFFCVLLHELGHALTARRYNIRTRDITLLPIGGMARFDKIPEKPKEELLVAVAGPIVNIIIGGVLFTILYLSNNLYLPDEESLRKITLGNFFFNLMLVNFVLAFFNILPAFPMDGGRIFRALLSFKMGRVKATNIASTIGQFLAIGFVFLGLFSNPFLIIIGLFVFIGAKFEFDQVQTTAILSEYKVEDVLMHQFPKLQVQDPLSKAVDIMLDSQEKAFIILDGKEVAGTLTRKELIGGLARAGKKVSLDEIMQKDFRKLTSDMPLHQVYQNMQQNNYEVLPVINNGKLEGIVDQENIIEYLQIKIALEEQDALDKLRKLENKKSDKA